MRLGNFKFKFPEFQQSRNAKGQICNIKPKPNDWDTKYCSQVESFLLNNFGKYE
jgi:hypothetical protein